MAEPTGADSGIDRLNIPFIIDRINVTDPEMIRKITTHPDIDRVHGVPTKKKPWWLQAYFPTTRFVDNNDDMFVPLTSTKDERYAGRRAYVVDKVQDGVLMEDVKKIAYLIHTKAPQLEIEKAVVNGVNRRFYGKDVPEDIVKCFITVFRLGRDVWSMAERSRHYGKQPHAGKTADKLADAIVTGYLPPKLHQQKVLDFIEANPEGLGGCPFADFSHHIGAAVQLLTPSCQFLAEEKNKGREILDIFTQDDMPMTVQTPRIAINDTTLDGLLDKPAKKNWTVFILQIREAAAKTKDPLFTFGAGVDERQCAFKFAFQKLMKDLQAELVRLEEGDAGAAAAVAADAKTEQGSSS